MFPQENLNADPSENAEEKITIDLDAQVEAANPEADFNERLAPAPAGVYPIKWSLAEKGVVPALSKNKQPYLSVYLQGELVADPPFDGMKTQYYMNSIVNPRSGTSEVHFFMAALGNPVPARISLGDLKNLIETTLAANPVGNVEADWRGSYQDGVDPKTNKPKWVEQYKHMGQFPIVDELDDAGNKTGKKIRSHIGKSAKDGEPVFAQFYIVKHLTQSDVKKLTKA